MLKVNLKTTMQEDFTRELESQAVKYVLYNMTVMSLKVRIPGY